MEVALAAIHVQKMKETVIMMDNARKVTSVELIIVLSNFTMSHLLIVVTNYVKEMIVVQLIIYVE